MINSLKKFMVQFYDKTFATLWAESLLFSVLIGIGFHSWLVTALLIIGLSWLISRPKGTIYVVVAMSSLWGYIAASIGYSFGGWPWAAVLGLVFLVKGVQIHFRKLKLSWVDLDFYVNNTVDLRRNWYMGRQNLN